MQRFNNIYVKENFQEVMSTEEFLLLPFQEASIKPFPFYCGQMLYLPNNFLLENRSNQAARRAFDKNSILIFEMNFSYEVSWI